MANKSLNKVMIIGNMGRDPEVRYLASGSAVANFTVATNERFQDKEGNWKERVEWHRVVFFGKTAETVGQYLSKGNRVYIEGSLSTREWEGKDGQKRSTTEIVGRNLIMLGGKGEGRSGEGGRSEGKGSDEPPPYEDSRPPDDDIPF